MGDSYKIYASQEYVDNKIADSVIQSNWNAKENESGYIENKPFYEEIVEGEILPLTTINFSNGLGGIVEKPALSIVDGKTYTVEWNGTQYTCQSHKVSLYGLNAVALGNSSVFTLIGSGVTGTQTTSDPFAMAYLPDEAIGSLGFYVYIVAADGSS